MTNCYKHPDVSAAATCVDCGQPICAECTRLLNGQTYCPGDYAIARFDEEGDPSAQLSGAKMGSSVAQVGDAQGEQHVLVEKYKGKASFLQSPALNMGIQPQQTAEVLAQYEETLPVAPAAPKDRTPVVAVAGLLCAIAALVVVNLLINDTSQTSAFVDKTSSEGVGAITAIIGGILTFIALYNRHESQHPRVVTWLGIISVVLLLVFIGDGVYLAYQAQLAADAAIRNIMGR